ncbi:hypothetical protein BDW62DRAFT_205467 [Aspergillus aurantiobrunneus]
MSSFDTRHNPPFGFGPPGAPPAFWQAHPGQPTGNPSGPIPRPFDAPPQAMPYDFPHPQPFYPPVPYMPDRGFGGPFKRPADQDYQNKLFLEEYRYPATHQTYQPPQVEAAVQGPYGETWRRENPSAVEAKPLAHGNKLRGDAPEFVPCWKPAANEESNSKAKEPCWFVVSST